MICFSRPQYCFPEVIGLIKGRKRTPLVTVNLSPLMKSLTSLRQKIERESIVTLILFSGSLKIEKREENWIGYRKLESAYMEALNSPRQ